MGMTMDGDGTSGTKGLAAVTGASTGIGMEHVDRIWELAMTADRPVVIDAKVDPNVIALPPHATFEQTKHLVLALAKGDADRNPILANPAKQWAA